MITYSITFLSLLCWCISFHCSISAEIYCEKDTNICWRWTGERREAPPQGGRWGPMDSREEEEQELRNSFGEPESCAPTINGRPGSQWGGAQVWNPPGVKTESQLGVFMPSLFGWMKNAFTARQKGRGVVGINSIVAQRGCAPRTPPGHGSLYGCVAACVAACVRALFN